MTALPTGTVTFLFTDIEGSTRLVADVGDQYAELLAEHRLLLRDAFSRHAGVEVDTQGDAFFIAFARAADAVAAAVEIQRGLDSSPVRVRIGIHTGEPTVTEEGYVGLDVVRGARICAAAHGGQVVISQATRELVSVEVRDLGEHRLRDIHGRLRLHQVGGQSFPPLRTVSWTNIPLPSSGLIGREHELAAVTDAFRRKNVRLLTLTGPGGAGKTRLAIEVASGLVDDFADGVFWIPLAGVSDPRLVASTAAGVVGAKRDLAEHVGSRRMLLLFDNFEQVVDAAPDLSALLRGCSGVRVLVTSREPLHITQEHEFPVSTLSEPDAVRLFTERAEAIRPGLASNGEVLDICRRLDCLPLAIELAAARTRVLEPRELLVRLEQRLPLLTGRARDVPRHQRTLRGTIEWSYELLEMDDRRLFRALGVFAGGWTIEAAADVCGATLDALESLVDKSLVRRQNDRLAMLQTIREYALERVERSRGFERLRRRHAEYYLRLVERIEPGLEGERQAELLDLVERELDNVRAALEWAFAGHDAELGTRLASSLSRFWMVRGYATEGRRWLDQALAAPDEKRPPAVTSRLLKAAAFVAAAQHDFEATKDLNLKRLTLARDQGDKAEEGRCLNNLGLSAEAEGDHDLAERRLRESISLLRELGQPAHVPLGNLARLTESKGDLEAATTFASESLAIASELGDLEQVQAMNMMLGWFEFRQGRTEEAIVKLRASFELAEQLQHRSAFRSLCETLADVMFEQDKLIRGAHLLGKAQRLREQLGMPEWNPQKAPRSTAALARVRRDLSKSELSEAMNTGRDADLHELVEDALADASNHPA